MTILISRHPCEGIFVYFPKPNGEPPNPPNPLKFVFWLFCWQLLNAQFWEGLKLLVEPKPPNPRLPKPPKPLFPNPPNWGWGAELTRLEMMRTRRAAAIMMRQSGDWFVEVFSVEISGDDWSCRRMAKRKKSYPPASVEVIMGSSASVEVIVGSLHKSSVKWKKARQRYESTSQHRGHCWVTIPWSSAALIITESKFLSWNKGSLEALDTPFLVTFLGGTPI